MTSITLYDHIPENLDSSFDVGYIRLFPFWVGRFKLFILFFVSYMNNIQSFLIKPPLRNIIITKAIQSSFIEKLSDELFDNSILLQQLTLNYDNSQCILLYLTGYVWFHIYINNSSKLLKKQQNKLMMIQTYHTTAVSTKSVFFLLFFLLFKNVNTAF